MAWDKDKPAGNQKIRLSDEEIRANWAALEDALAREHTFPGALGSTAGQHTPLIANLQKQAYTAAAAGGTVDAITAVFAPPLAALTDKLLVCVVAAGANTTTTPSFAPDGLAAKTIVKGLNEAVRPGDIPGANYPAFFLFNAIRDAWILLNPAVRGIIQVVNYQTGAVASGSTIMPADDTIPQNTEGNEYMTLAITPTNVNHKLKIEVVAVVSTGTIREVCGALFQDSNANALAAAITTILSGAYHAIIVFTHYMAAGTISPTTFKFRAGPASAATLTFNGINSTDRFFGGVMSSSMTITEIKD